MKPIIRKPTKKEIIMAELWPTWEKEKSEFPWEYNIKETCLILEGKAIIKTKEGEFGFEKGDIVEFPEGLHCIWIIKERIKKHYNFG